MTIAVAGLVVGRTTASGHRLGFHRGGGTVGTPPQANNDPDPGQTIAAFWGGAAVTIRVLDNDIYQGTPTITFPNGSTTGRGASLALNAAGDAVVYTPPSGGPGTLTDTFTYRLTADQNAGSSDATVTVTLSAVTTFAQKIADLAQFGTVRHWPMGESSGSTLTEVIVGHHGSWGSTTPAFGQAAVVAGSSVGTSTALSGNDSATIPTAPVFQASEGTFGWHGTLDDDDAARTVISVDDGGANTVGAMGIEVEPGGVARLYFYNSDGAGGRTLLQVAAGSLPTDGTPYGGFVTWGPNGLRYYVGTGPGAVSLAASVPTPINANLAAVLMRVGAWAPNPALKPYVGRLQHLWFCAAELTQEVLATVCQPVVPAPVAVADTGLVAIQGQINILNVLANDQNTGLSPTIEITQQPGIGGTATVENNGSTGAVIHWNPGATAAGTAWSLQYRLVTSGGTSAAVTASGTVQAQAASDYVGAVDNLSPASHWRMNEASGTVIDDRRPAGVDGTLTATGIQYFATTLAEDDAQGRSIGFNGSTGRATIPHNAAHKPAGGGGVAFLMHADRINVAQQVLVASDADNAIGGWSIEMKYSRIRAYLRDAGNVVREVRQWRAYQDGTGPFRVGLGSTHHVALTWGPAGGGMAARLRLYVDGVLEATFDTAAVASGSSPISVGAWHDGSNAFDGLINNLVVFSSRPTTAQIQTLAKARPSLDHTPDFTVATVAPGSNGASIRSTLASLLVNSGPKKLKFTSGNTYTVLPAGRGGPSYAQRVPVFDLPGVQNLVVESTDRNNRAIIRLGAISKSVDDLWHPIFLVHDASVGVEFRDLEIDGNRAAYFDGNVTIGVTDGAMCGITIDGSDVTCVRRCHIHHCHADNILHSHDQPNGTRRCREARITGCLLEWGRRQNYTIEDITDCELDNTRFFDAGRPIGANTGESPRSGIDSEGWTDPGEQYVLLHDCEFRRNGMRAVVLEGFGDSSFRSGGSARRFWRIWGNTMLENGTNASGDDRGDMFLACRPQTNMFIEDIEFMENTCGQFRASWASTAGPITRITVVDNTFRAHNYPTSSANIYITNAVQMNNSTILRNACPSGLSVTSNRPGSTVQSGSQTPTPQSPPT